MEIDPKAVATPIAEDFHKSVQIAEAMFAIWTGMTSCTFDIRSYR
jgi:hypothetical protein